MKYKLSIGADPEYFVVEKETSKIIPACGKFGGSKKSPILLSPDGGFLEDGAAVEFNVSPSPTFQECRKKLDTLITAFLTLNPKVRLYDSGTAHFDRKTLRENPQANVIGCEPDYYVYGLRDLPSVSQFKGERFAGGHIHIGIDPWPEGLDKRTFISYLDVVFLAPFSHLTANPYRWPFYGYPGLYRETSYGVEYRSPCNWWCNPEWATQGPKYGALQAQALSDWNSKLQDFVSALASHGGDKVEYSIDYYLKASELYKTLASPSVRNSPSKLGLYRTHAQELHTRVLRGA